MLCSVLGTSPEESQLKTRTRSSASQDSCTPHARLMPAQMMKGMEGLKSHSRATQQRQRFNPNRSLSPFTCCCDKKPAPHLSVDMAEWNPDPLRPYPAHSSRNPSPGPGSCTLYGTCFCSCSVCHNRDGMAFLLSCLSWSLPSKLCPQHSLHTSGSSECRQALPLILYRQELKHTD